jgi:3-hydroxypropanoate dehydrogenase
MNLDTAFLEGRTYKEFDAKAVSGELLKEIYDLMKMGPTSGNCCPLRITFVSSKEAKEKLLKCVMEGNIEAVKSAPITAIFAYDLRFFEKMDKLHPTGTALREMFANSEPMSLDTATRNSTLQAAYFMIVARSRDLVLGPMSGFNKKALDEAFFGDKPYIKSNFICNIGYPKGEPKYPRLPRLDFEEVCEIV